MMLQSATLNSGFHGIKDPGLWEGDRIPDATCQEKKKKLRKDSLLGLSGLSAIGLVGLLFEHF